MAEQLQAAARTAAERQSAVRMRLPFETTLDDREPRFYALPQPAMPPKDAMRPPAQVVVPPGHQRLSRPQSVAERMNCSRSVVARSDSDRNDSSCLERDASSSSLASRALR